MIESSITYIQEIIATYGAWGVFVATLIEEVVAPIPSALVPLAAGVQVSLVAFGVAAFFHPIAYQFYFFMIAGLAVALKSTYLAEKPRA